jgi:hypothetical protein
MPLAVVVIRYLTSLALADTVTPDSPFSGGRDEGGDKDREPQPEGYELLVR